MGDQQLSNQPPTTSATSHNQGPIRVNNPQHLVVIETKAMDWLGAEAIVIFPEGDLCGSPR